jgi:histone acetyltransferase (RNA polymerase elongator complex component)
VSKSRLKLSAALVETVPYDDNVLLRDVSVAIVEFYRTWIAISIIEFHIPIHILWRSELRTRIRDLHFLDLRSGAVKQGCGEIVPELED